MLTMRIARDNPYNRSNQAQSESMVRTDKENPVNKAQQTISDRIHNLCEKVDIGGIVVGILLVGFMVFLMVATP